MRSVWFYIIACLMLAGCSAEKFVPEGERLYTEPGIKYIHDKKMRSKSVAETQVDEIMRPEPNKSFLGSRPALWIWYKFGDPNEPADSAGWIKRKLGKPPVYLSQANPEAVSKAINAALYNKGFFDSYCTYQLDDKGKTATYTYTVNLFDPYRIAAVEWPGDSTEITRAILLDTGATQLRINRRYDLDKLISERLRIDEDLKEKGFYFFSDRHINYRMDTTLGGRTVKLFVYIKKDAPLVALVPYQIRRVNVFTNYSIVADTSPYIINVLDSVHFYQRAEYIRPMPVKRAVFFSEGKTYSRTDHNLTLSRLSDLGVFKFVNVKLHASDSAPRYLDANIQLTPLPRKSISTELMGASKSNNFIGPSFTVRFRNRNALRGAELLIANVATGFETQLNGPFKGQYTYEFNPKVELYVPRFFLPQKLVKTKSMFVPKTKFVLDYSYTSRVNYFNIQSTRFSYGYKWKPNLAMDHDLGLQNITYFNIYNESDAFKALLGENVFLKRRFEKQFIEGVTYNFMYNEQVLPKVKHPLYVSVNAEVAGSLLALRNINKKRTNGEPFQVLNVNYAQFARLEVELRKYFKPDNRNRRYLATRVLAGWGLPYGNSTNMPYIRQFFSGGAYSVRGFPSFSLGPGTYYPPDSLRTGFFLQQGGEIKLEANAEYRFSFNKIFKGAFFADAGNTWLNKANPELPGAAFGFNSFLKETAVGMGLGVRADVQFFVLRLDLGMPVRKPWYPDGQRWRFSAIDFSSPQWRRDNLVLNIAFGYPF